MKRVIILLAVIATLSPAFAMADGKDKGKKAKAAKETPVNDKEIEWLTIDEVQVKMHDEPRQVYIDVYTDWCGWCKRMDATTFKNPDVIKYMNKHYYAVKFNAERTDSLRFQGEIYGFDPQYRANDLAVKLMQGKMSFPTAVIFLSPNFQNPNAIPGYQDVRTMEMILKYIAEDKFKTVSFPDYQKQFKPTWAAQ